MIDLHVNIRVDKIKFTFLMRKYKDNMKEAFVLILFIILAFLAYSTMETERDYDHNPNDRINFVSFPLEGYWKHGFHNMLIGIDGNKIILTSRVGKQYIRKYGVITDVYDNCLHYTCEGVKHKIEYFETYILWNGQKYMNPELDNMRVSL
jgi:hypothetical protein